MQNGEKAATDHAAKLVAAAREQIGVTTAYDPSYTGLAYPGGDVPRSRGVCTDVVIRAYRDAFGLDLQKLVHEDMMANFSAYPDNWGLRSADRNIDHRRVPNLQAFLKRQEAALPLSTGPGDWQVGDLFTSKVGGRLPHIGIVSARQSDGTLLAVHNIGRGAREEAVVFAHPLDGHFRWQV
ncbi:DUF1287 domain-containing protein [Pontixanthobacter aestiaquae]|uniref:DUF1287 domain-containing protein n=1 Tax=Pontixanthobacter aestiaquae TaxID=1509367 RepID=UPI0019262B60|nr:DUF1287 domain-containing protein [Pontixanthobacter aestiaquae]MDN3645419.1 DUF1287 domain-containing protein [Pontixanthobacter aestiaquae]